MKKSVPLMLCTILLLAASALAEVPMPRSNHVVVLVLENHSYKTVVGNTSMPYFDGLISKYGLAKNYYANIPGSLKDYLIMTGGSTYPQNGCGGRGCSSTIKADNIVRHFLLGGISWKAYLEDLPSTGSLVYQSGGYDKWHNPFAWFTDVANSSSERLNMVNMNGLLTDLKNNTLPQLSFIVPNAAHGAYTGTLGAADLWLSQMVPKILANPGFKTDGILFITFDEGTPNTDTACSATVTTGCAGHIATLVIGPRVKPGYKSTVYHKHQAILRSVIQALGITSKGYLGLSATTTNMAEFFQ